MDLSEPAGQQVKQPVQDGSSKLAQERHHNAAMYPGTSHRLEGDTSVLTRKHSSLVG